MTRPSNVAARHGRLRRLAGAPDLASLTDRTTLLAFTRLGMAAAALVTALAAPATSGLGTAGARAAIAGYALAVVAGLAAARSGPRAGVVAATVLGGVDALWLAVMVTPGGGARSPLAVLVLVQAVALAALVGARAGAVAVATDLIVLVAARSGALEGRIDSALGVPAAASAAPAAVGLLAAGAAAAALVAWGGGHIGAIELRRSRLELEVFAAMAGALEGAADPEVCLEALLVHAGAALEARRGAVVRPGAADLVLDADVPGGVRAAPAGQAPAAAGTAGGVVAAARAERHPLVRQHLDPADPAAALLPGARNVVACAVGAGPDAPVVLLEHGARSEGQRLARRTRLVVGQFAAHAALALSAVAVLTERERQAGVDPLTGLANRRQFDATLAREVAIATRRAEPLTLALVDVDHFKRVNDRNGHLAGDAVLRRLAEVLGEESRDTDLVARYGGEEFVLVLPSCSSVGALRVLRRIDASIAADAALAGVTVSSGVATLGEHAADGTGLVAAADEALYASKRAGRNRATVASRRRVPLELVGAGETAAPALSLPARRR
ncbi:MAG TPA: GGDEF domain-containing protein [Acidimicrobiales bacterium]|nr:GGDEF domain-containing protein [Acidimicrobiales bacterium]